jgi:hypothetical protein
VAQATANDAHVLVELADLRAEVAALRRAIRPFVLGQVSSLPEGAVIIVSAVELAEAKQAFLAGRRAQRPVLVEEDECRICA